MSPNISLNKSFQIRNESELKKWVENHLSFFEKGSLFLLRGDLGAGKTTLVSCIVEALGGDRSQVSSPTFSLHHIYKTVHFEIDHMDLYRLENDYDLASSGFFEVLENVDHLSFIEWAERVEEKIYKDSREKVYWIQLEMQKDEQTRVLSLKLLD